MLNQEMTDILGRSASTGWIMEPDAKRLLRLAGIDTTRFIFTDDPEAAGAFAKDLGYPVVAKVVSPRIVHKSDVGGVAAGITNEGDLNRAFGRMMLLDGATGVIVEEMVKGVELIAGAKIDDQFGPIVLLGAGGTAVEIYKDVALRMAPLVEKDVESMLASLKARPLLEGYRGADPINVEALTVMLLNFSALLMDLGDRIESIDLNPVICSSTRSVVADARIMLR